MYILPREGLKNNKDRAVLQFVKFIDYVPEITKKKVIHPQSWCAQTCFALRISEECLFLGFRFYCHFPFQYFNPDHPLVRTGKF